MRCQSLLIALTLFLTPGPKPEVDRPTIPVPIPVVSIATTRWCGVCHAWQQDDSPANQQIAKRWIRIDLPRAAHLSIEEWEWVRDHINSHDGLVPAVWWPDSNGKIQVLSGRYTDAQILDSMQQAETRAAQRRKQM